MSGETLNASNSTSQKKISISMKERERQFKNTSFNSSVNLTGINEGVHPIEKYSVNGENSRNWIGGNTIFNTSDTENSNLHSGTVNNVNKRNNGNNTNSGSNINNGNNINNINSGNGYKFQTITVHQNNNNNFMTGTMATNNSHSYHYLPPKDKLQNQTYNQPVSHNQSVYSTKKTPQFDYSNSRTESGQRLNNIIRLS